MACNCDWLLHNAPDCSKHLPLLMCFMTCNRTSPASCLDPNHLHTNQLFRVLMQVPPSVSPVAVAAAIACSCLYCPPLQPSVPQLTQPVPPSTLFLAATAPMTSASN